MGRDFSWFVLIILRIGTAPSPKREAEQLAARRSKNVLWLRTKCPAPVCSDWAKEPLTTYINPNCPKDVAVAGDQAGKIDQCVAQLQVCYLSAVLCFLLSFFLPSFALFQDHHYHSFQRVPRRSRKTAGFPLLPRRQTGWVLYSRELSERN